MIELRHPTRARAWLSAGLANVRVGAAGDEPDVALIAELLGERGNLPPVGVVIDIDRIIAGQPPRPDDTCSAPVSLRAPLRIYRDQLLSRIESSIELERIADACAALATAPLRRRAVTLVIDRLLGRLGFTGGVALAPQHVRELSAGPVEAPVGDADLELLANGYRELAAAARRVGRLLEPSDTFLVERVEALGDLSQRLAIAEIGEAELAITRRLPRRVVGRRRDRARQVMARMTEEETYPTGGFSAISTSGSLENLVSSELIYMDRSHHSDLFDLRWAEGELLHYTRDDSLFFRGRRSIVFAVMPDCIRARVKDRGADQQRLIAALGLLLAVLGRLESWLDADALEVRWLFVAAPSGDRPLDDEQALADILCGPWSKRGVASVESVRAVPEVVEATAATETASLVITCNEDSPLISADIAGTLEIGTARPGLRWRHSPEVRRAPAVATVDDCWTWCATEILAELV